MPTESDFPQVSFSLLTIWPGLRCVRFTDSMHRRWDKLLWYLLHLMIPVLQLFLDQNQNNERCRYHRTAALCVPINICWSYWFDLICLIFVDAAKTVKTKETGTRTGDIVIYRTIPGTGVRPHHRHISLPEMCVRDYIHCAAVRADYRHHTSIVVFHVILLVEGRTNISPFLKR